MHLITLIILLDTVKPTAVGKAHMTVWVKYRFRIQKIPKETNYFLNPILGPKWVFADVFLAVMIVKSLTLVL